MLGIRKSPFLSHDEAIEQVMLVLSAEALKAGEPFTEAEKKALHTMDWIGRFLQPFEVRPKY